MKRISEETVEECFSPCQISKTDRNWKVITEYGRPFEFNDQGFDLSQCLTALLPEETEEQREEMTFAACSFCQIAYGCVDVRSTPSKGRFNLTEYAKRYGFSVDDNPYRPFGVSEVIKVFGEAAIVENSWFPRGWRVSVPSVGFVVIALKRGELVIKAISGDLYSDALRFLKQRQGHGVVSGNSGFCAMCVVHGETLGIQVIPEVPRGLLANYMIGNVAWVPGIVLGFLLDGIVSGLAFWEKFTVGWLVALVVFYFLKGDARKRGRALLNQSPTLAPRDARIDDIRAKGMI